MSFLSVLTKQHLIERHEKSLVSTNFSSDLDILVGMPTDTVSGNISFICNEETFVASCLRVQDFQNKEKRKSKEEKKETHKMAAS